VALDEWARIVRELNGITEPATSAGYLGAVRCTLAARRDLHHGARSERRDQHWPEFPFARASEAACLIHIAIRSPGMPEALAEIIVANYVPLAPRSRQIRAELLGLSRPDYYARLARARDFLRGMMMRFQRDQKVSDSLALKTG